MCLELMLVGVNLNFIFFSVLILGTGISVAILKPTALSESALVAQTVKQAIKGKTAIVDEILDTELPKLPNWYNDNTLESDYKDRLVASTKKDDSKAKVAKSTKIKISKKTQTK